MGKKKIDVMAKMKASFVSGAEQRGKARDKAIALWDYIEPFAGYGFNKSHSVAYAMLAYRTAFLKTHYPVAFMAAMLNSELSSSDAIAKYLAECRNMGIEILTPDVNQSEYFFTVGGNQIRFGLGAIKGVGEGAVEELLAVRRRVGPFRSLAQIACEVEGRLANRKVYESLIKAGALDGFGLHRAALWTALDRILDYGQHRRREREEGQGSLFGGMGGATSLEPAIPTSVPIWPERERLRYEKETLGFYLSGNPLSEHEEVLSHFATHTIGLLKEGYEGPATVGGLVIGLKKVKIKSGPNAGRFMGRFVLEDLEGGLPVTLFANQLQQFGHLLTEEAVILVKGEIRERGGEPELTVEDITPLEKLSDRTLTGIELRLAGPVATSEMLKLRDLLLENPGPVAVKLSVQMGGKQISLTTQDNFKVDFSPTLAAGLKNLLGPDCVRERYAPSAFDLAPVPEPSPV
jgi:DNA polymerase-3 subunit alpha